MINHFMSPHFMIIYGLCLISAFFLTGGIRRYALATGLMDTPNARSAHTRPVPRGGGVSFVLCFLTAIVLLAVNHRLPVESTLLFALPSAIVALLGYMDDRHNVPSLLRLAAHLLLACITIVWINPVNLLPEVHYPLLILFSFAAVIYLAGSLNAFNFMDGINGLAGFQAIFLGICGGGLFYLYQDLAAVVLLLILAASVMGFVVWNFPNARIFMGDVGSGFLGFVFGLFSLQALYLDFNLFCSWMILSSLFFVDTSVTLFFRSLHRQPLFKAHNTHAYQKLTQRVGKHWPVTLGAQLLNYLWLLPLAFAVATEQLNPWYGLILAYVSLTMLALFLQAGRPQAAVEAIEK